jgi:ElaB/YqjD/DUF883 family membrane-anchored ribosome-binding protein
MPDTDPLKISTSVELGEFQQSLQDLTAAVQEAAEKMRSAFAESSSKVHESTKHAEEGVGSLGEAFKKLAENVYENVKTPLGEAVEKIAPFVEGLSGITVGIAAAVGAASVFGAELVHLGFEFAETARHLETQSKMFGVSTEQMQLLGKEAERLGLNAGSITFGLRSLARVFSQAGDSAEGMMGGTSKAKEILRDYGITGSNTQEKLEKLIEAIRTTTNEAERQAMVIGLVGGRGLMLLPVLEDLADRGYENIKEEMKEVNTLLSEQAIKAGTDAYEANFKLKESWEGLKNTIAVAVDPWLTSWETHLTNIIKLHGILGGLSPTNWLTDLMVPSGGESAESNPALAGMNEMMGVLSEIHKHDKQAIDSLVNSIKQADAEGKNHIVTLMAHAAAIRQLAAEFGEKAPTDIKKFVNELKQAAEVMNEHFATEMHAGLEKMTREWEQLKKNRRELDSEMVKSTLESQKELGEETEKLNKNLLKEIERAVKEQRGLRQEEINFEEVLGKQQLDAETRNIDFLLSTKRISAERAIELKKRVAAEELAIEARKIQAEIELEKLSPDNEVKVKQLQDKLIELKRQYNEKVKTLDNQLITAQNQKWMTFFDEVRSNFQTSINGFLQGTQSFAQAMAGVWNSILMSFINMLENMLLNWIEKHVMMAIFGKAIQSSTAVQEVISNAAVGAAAAGASVAAIPVVGWAMVPEVMAATFAEISAMTGPATMEKGGVVPTDNFPILGHKDEWMLPAPITAGLRSIIDSQGQGGAGKGPMTFHISPVFQVMAIDSENVASFFESNRGQMANTIAGMVKDRLLKVTP